MFAAGKAALEDNPGRFNKEASEMYQRLSEEEKESLRAHISEPVQMTKREVCHKAAKLFEMIQKSVCPIYTCTNDLASMWWECKNSFSRVHTGKHENLVPEYKL